MMGRKDKTLPTPAQTPSMSRDWSQGLTLARASSPANSAVSQSIPWSNNSCSGAPMTVKVNQKIKSMIPKKIGMPKYLWVRTRSIFSDRSCSLVSWCRVTQSEQIFSM